MCRSFLGEPVARSVAGSARHLCRFRFTQEIVHPTCTVAEYGKLRGSETGELHVDGCSCMSMAVAAVLHASY